MIKPGDRVKFISDTGTGIVRSISGNLAQVEVDGFEIPALLSDIVEVSREEENAAIVKIGPSDPKPGREAGHAGGGRPPEAVKSKGQRVPEHYGRISLAADYEDDEPIVLRRQRRPEAVAAEQPAAATEKPVIEKAPFEETGYEVKLAFVRAGEDPVTAGLDAYLVNDSSYELYYNFAVWKKGYVLTIASGRAQADSKEKVGTFARSELSEIVTLHVSLLPFKSTSFVPRGTEDFDLELHPLKFVRPGAFAENDYFDEPALLFTLASSSIGPAVIPPAPAGEKPEKEQLGDRPKHKGRGQDIEIVDLHAENILDDTEGLSPGEILKVQLARFTVALDGALKGGKPSKIVFIHGVGKGKLKYEMKKVLDQQYSKLRYQDASFAEYGYGAIMVFMGK